MKKLICVVLAMMMAFSTAITAIAENIPEFETEEKSEVLNASGDEIFTSIEAAGEYLRGEMKKRTSTVTIKVLFDDCSLQTCNDIYNEALKHTGVPDEGDYLRYSHDEANESYEYDDGISEGLGYSTIVYNLAYYTTLSQETTVTSYIKNLKESFNMDSKTTYEKVKIIYDYIFNNIDYDSTSLNGTLKYTAYAAIVQKSAGFKGISTLLYRLCLEYGIDSRVISGKVKVTTTESGKDPVSKESSVYWNTVKIGDNYYNVDATYDGMFNQKDGQGNPKYYFFLKSNSGFALYMGSSSKTVKYDHLRSDEFFLPEYNDKYTMATKNYSGSSTSSVQSIELEGKCYDNELLMEDGEYFIPNELSVSVETREVNPVYKDVVDESILDIAYPIDLSDFANKNAEESDFTNIITEVAKSVREKMVARTGTFTVYYKANGLSEQVTRDILSEAMRHTGESTEGDYIKWNIGGYKAVSNINKSSETGDYYYTITYTIPYYTNASQEGELTTAIASVKSGLNLEGKDDYEKILAIYDYICSNVEYDYENLENDDYKIKYTAYAALINGTSVCQGFASLFYRLCLEYDIDTRLIAGNGNDTNHAWNIVELSGLYFNADTTWDEGKKFGAYENFLKSNYTFADHIRFADYEPYETFSCYTMAEHDYGSYTEEIENIIAKSWETAFPDENFRTFVWYDVLGKTATINKTAKILFKDANEIVSYKQMDCHEVEIESMEGIELFTGLEELYCNGNSITELDLSNNTKLKILHAYNNKIATLNISGLEALTELYCDNNELESLDLSDNTNLKFLTCGYNDLGALDLSNNLKLKNVNAEGNHFKGIILSDEVYSNYSEFDFGDRQLIEMDSLPSTINMEEFTGVTNPEITFINSEDNFEYDNNYTMTLDSDCYIFCYDIEIPINVQGGSKSISLNDVIVFDKNNTYKITLTESEAPENTDNQIIAVKNQETNLSFGFLKDNEMQIGWSEQINATEPTVPIYGYYSGNADVTLYAVYENIDTSVLENKTWAEAFPDAGFRQYVRWDICDLAENPGSTTKIGKENAKKIIATEYIFCDDEEIESLEGIEYFKYLKMLSCSNNKLSTFDVSKNEYLYGIYCRWCKLTELDISKNAMLRFLYCDFNELTELDISNNIHLNELLISGNKLKGITLGTNTLEKLYENEGFDQTIRIDGFDESIDLADFSGMDKAYISYEGEGDYNSETGVLTLPENEPMFEYEVTVPVYDGEKNLVLKVMVYDINAINTITYYSNDGTNRETETIKYKDETEYITGYFEREGYILVGWSTEADSDKVEYVTADEYSENEDLDLYAVWKEGYVVYYNCNDSSMNYSSPHNGDKEFLYYKENGLDAKIKYCDEIEMYYNGKVFLGWATDSEAVTAEYVGGETVTLTEDLYLYAIWRDSIVDDAYIITEDGEGNLGDFVTVGVLFTSNGAIESYNVKEMNLRVGYDKNVLKFSGIVDSELTGWNYNEETGMLTWKNSTVKSIDATGEGTEILKLKFEILAPNVYDSTMVMISDAEIIGTSKIMATLEGGTITIKSVLYGDVDGDGDRDAIDLLRLSKYIANAKVTIDETYSDVNGDGKISATDLIRLSKRLSGMDVPMGPKVN